MRLRTISSFRFMPPENVFTGLNISRSMPRIAESSRTRSRYSIGMSAKNGRYGKRP